MPWDDVDKMHAVPLQLLALRHQTGVAAALSMQKPPHLCDTSEPMRRGRKRTAERHIASAVCGTAHGLRIAPVKRVLDTGLVRWREGWTAVRGSRRHRRLIGHHWRWPPWTLTRTVDPGGSAPPMMWRGSRATLLKGSP